MKSQKNYISNIKNTKNETFHCVKLKYVFNFVIKGFYSS